MQLAIRRVGNASQGVSVYFIYSFLTAEKDVQVARKKGRGGGGGNSGNARKKTFFFTGGVPLVVQDKTTHERKDKTAQNLSLI